MCVCVCMCGYTYSYICMRACVLVSYSYLVLYFVDGFTQSTVATAIFLPLTPHMVGKSCSYI